MAHHTLIIEHTGGANIGRCYNSMSYKVSSIYKLNSEKLSQLFKMGFIGYGQEFQIYSPCDGTEQAVKDESGEEFYVYKTEARVDSSD